MGLNITEEMINQMYTTKEVYNKQLCDRFYFGSWTGYDHPVRLKNPMNYIEALAQKRYYEATFCNKNREPLFVLLKAIKLTTEPFESEFLSKQLQKPNGEYYFLVEYSDNKIVLGKEITIKKTVDLDKYINIVIETHPAFTNERIVKSSEIVTRNLKYSYEYIYDDKGLLKKLIVSNSEGTNILDY